MNTLTDLGERIIKTEKERDQLKHQGNLLREDIALLKNNQKTRDKLIDNLKEENANINKELDQYKTAHDKLTAGLKEAVEESIKYKRERDELITDIQKQRELLKDFSRFIHRKVEACPGKKEYMDFRDRLNELGIRERE
ncbi:hypothetical protein ACI6CX_01455 [Mammaliicoccus sciuri]|uniref:hypothetical protein n=1 Tax=Mammaliicoccus sciuri TaxID=1296 RepID=UPI003853BD9B